MTIPDPLVYSSVTVIVGGCVWAGKQFVLSVTGKTDQAAQQQGPRLSMADYEVFSRMTTQALNGRYAFAPEVRELFAAVNGRIDNLIHEMQKLRDNRSVGGD